jgi:hypothetical protein
MNDSCPKELGTALKSLLKNVETFQVRGSVRFETGRHLTLNGKEFTVSILIEEKELPRDA